MTADAVPQTASILLVEDDDSIREPLAELLGDEGYAVLQAGHGGEALDMLDGGARPAAIVLDLTMPVVDGPEVLARLRADKRWRAIPVIVVSASIPHSLGAVAAFLKKPFSIDDLLTALADAVSA